MPKMKRGNPPQTQTIKDPVAAAVGGGPAVALVTEPAVGIAEIPTSEIEDVIRRMSEAESLQPPSRDQYLARNATFEKELESLDREASAAFQGIEHPAGEDVYRKIRQRFGQRREKLCRGHYGVERTIARRNWALGLVAIVEEAERLIIASGPERARILEAEQHFRLDVDTYLRKQTLIRLVDTTGRFRQFVDGAGRELRSTLAPQALVSKMAALDARRQQLMQNGSYGSEAARSVILEALETTNAAYRDLESKVMSWDWDELLTLCPNQ